MTSLTLLYRIEKKRVVVPALAAAVHDAVGREVDWEILNMHPYFRRAGKDGNRMTI